MFYVILNDNFDHGSKVLGYFLDIKKAFDCEIHKLLLKKTSSYLFKRKNV